MRAAVFESVGSPVVLKEIDEPQAQAGDAVLKVLSTPILAYAKHVFSGKLPYPSLVPLVPGTSHPRYLLRYHLTIRGLVCRPNRFCRTRDRSSPKRPASLLRHHSPSKRQPQYNNPTRSFCSRTKWGAKAPRILPQQFLGRKSPRSSRKCSSYPRRIIREIRSRQVDPD